MAFAAWIYLIVSIRQPMPGTAIIERWPLT
jgi:hypothetical protein